MEIHQEFLEWLLPILLNQYKKESEKWFTKIIDYLTNQGYNNKITTDVITTPMSIVGAIVDYAENKILMLLY
jgi:hypothetical protein